MPTLKLCLALLTVIQPDNTHIDYRYDAAHRLVNLQNSQGDSLTYTLGATGNRLREDWKNPSGTLTKTLQRQYDGFARLSRELGAQGQTTHYQYDNNDNLTQITDPLQRVTHYQYDSLNRLSQETDPTNAATHYHYDASDRTTQVSDHNNNATQYSYDGLGNRIEQHSPDTGSTTASYDTAGNLLSRTDANGQTTTYRYDANNRPIETRFVDGTTISYQYDTAPNGIGRLANITDPSGTTAWQYDPHGRITAKLQTITLLGNNGNRPLTTRYRYDSAGRLTETTYPSGLKVAYSYTNGNIASLKLNGKAWLNTIRYQPDGNVAAWTWADGSQQQRGYDQDGQLISQTLGGNQRTLNYDSVGNITALIDPQTTLNLNYDAADRLIAANSQHWQYDPNSNRIQQQDNNGVTDYTIDPSSNRLLSSTGKNYQTYQHDANGNTLQDTAHSYHYDAQNRLVAVDNGKTAQYRHNALGQRVYKKAQQLDCDYTHDGSITNADVHAVNGKEGKTDSQTKGKDVHTVNGKESHAKTGSDSAKGKAEDKDKGKNKENGKTVACAATQIGDHANHGKNQSKSAKPTDGLLFAYDETGKLIGEYTTNGNAQQETVWLGNLPIATVKDNTPYAIHTDHLGTPRIITNSKKRVIWRWNSDPFGTTLANEDPDGDGKAFTYNLRFAGQYYDKETGLHYNYFRDYDPRTGRYVESDPIGLDGGINTYGYVGGNPLGFIDSHGLSVDPDPSSPWYLKLAVGTWVHSEFSRYIEGQKNGDLQTNNTFQGVFGDFRPDVFNSKDGDIWELKPATCKSGDRNKDARRQLRNYVKTGNKNPDTPVQWKIGLSSKLLASPVQRIGWYGGSQYEITFYPDPNDNTSGLIFYDLNKTGSCECE